MGLTVAELPTVQAEAEQSHDDVKITLGKTLLQYLILCKCKKLPMETGCKSLRQGNLNAPKQRRILEINPTHPLLSTLHEHFQRQQDAPVLGDYAELLLGYSLLAEGMELHDPVRFAQLVAALMVQILTGGT